MGRHKKEGDLDAPFPKARGVADPMDCRELASLSKKLRTVAEVACLPAPQQIELARLVAEALNHSRAGQAKPLSVGLPTRRGRPPTPHRAHFINDIVKAWFNVTGVCVKVWHDDCRNESSVTLRIALATAVSARDLVSVSGFKKRARRASEVQKKAGL